MIKETTHKHVDSFPSEVRTTSVRDAVEFMPPVLDEETGKITYFCVLCKQTKTAEADEPINFFFRETFRNNGQTDQQGNCCPECFNKGHR